MTNEMTMDAATLKALRGSIVKWQLIVDGTGIDKGPDNCPLCQMFNNMVNPKAQAACRGCPVREATGVARCEGTPYEQYSDLDQDLDDKERAEAAVEELEFLKSLLPENVDV
jgi:hypothetical protein